MFDEDFDPRTLFLFVIEFAVFTVFLGVFLPYYLDVLEDQSVRTDVFLWGSVALAVTVVAATLILAYRHEPSAPGIAFSALITASVLGLGMAGLFELSLRLLGEAQPSITTITPTSVVWVTVSPTSLLRTATIPASAVPATPTRVPTLTPTATPEELRRVYALAAGTVFQGEDGVWLATNWREMAFLPLAGLPDQPRLVKPRVQLSPDSGDVLAVTASNWQHGAVAVATMTDSEGFLYLQTAGSFQEFHWPADQRFRGLAMLGPTAFLGTDFGLYRYSYTGEGVISPDELDLPAPYGVTALGGSSKAVCVATSVYASVPDPHRVYRTVDGLTWTPVPLAETPDEAIRGLWCDAEHVIAVRADGKIITDESAASQLLPGQVRAVCFSRLGELLVLVHQAGRDTLFQVTEDGWASMPVGLPCQNVIDIALGCQEGTAEPVIFLACDIGLYYRARIEGDEPWHFVSLP